MPTSPRTAEATPQKRTPWRMAHRLASWWSGRKPDLLHLLLLVGGWRGWGGWGRWWLCVEGVGVGRHAGPCVPEVAVLLEDVLLPRDRLHARLEGPHVEAHLPFWFVGFWGGWVGEQGQ